MKTAKDLELSLLLKEKEIQELQLQIDHEYSTVAEYGKRIIDAINFIEKYKKKYHYDLIKNNHLEKIINILQGSDKE